MRVKPLTSLIIEPTNTCNLRCSFCFVTEGMSREEGFMDLALFKKVIDDTPELEHLCMHNWGEPLLHKEIFENEARNYGLKVTKTIDISGELSLGKTKIKESVLMV